MDVVGARLQSLDESYDEIITSIPESLVAAPDDFVLDPQLSADPYTPLLRLRDEGRFVVRGENGLYAGVPIPDLFGHVAAGREQFIVLGASEMDRISLKPKEFINGGAYGSHTETIGVIPTMVDGKDHADLRALYNVVLNHKAMQTRAETLINPLVDFLLDRMEAKAKRGEPIDIPRDLALPLTYKAMSTMIGVPQEKFAEFVHLGEILFTGPIQPDRGVAASRALLEFYLVEAEKRKAKPEKDLITWFLNADVRGRDFGSDQVAVQARFLLPAGVETTWRQLALMFVGLLSHPDQYRQVADDPSLVPQAVEEVIRFLPSGFVVPRLSGDQDIEVGGTLIPADSGIIMFQGPINRDPRRWEQPDAFDIHRPFITNRTFNVGIHGCAGQHLARLEMVSVLDKIVRRFPGLNLTCAPGDLRIRGLTVRTPMQVPVSLS